MTLDTVPVKSAAGFSQEAGVVLLMPRYPTFAGRIMGKLLRRSTHIRVKLDELGSAVWKLIDGNRSIRQIGDELQASFGEAAAPVQARLAEFLEILLRNRFITLTTQPEVCNVE